MDTEEIIAGLFDVFDANHDNVIPRGEMINLVIALAL
jgi:Ca2+-binding EF-hand superfamily protein